MSGTSIGMMDPAYFVGRKAILTWLNETFCMNLQKIEETASGAVACQICDAIFPGAVNMTKVRWDAKSTHEFLDNYKVLQQLFEKKGIDKYLEVEKLCRAKYQDNLENMQWFKSFYERNYAGQAYDPLTRRTKGRGADSMPAFTTNAAIQHSAREQRQAEDGEEEAAAAAAAGAGAGAGAPVATKAPAVAAPKRPGAAPAAAGAASKMGGGVGAAGAAGRPAAAAAAGTAPAGKPVVAGAAGARIHGVAGSSSSAAAAGGAGAEALRVASRRIEELQGQVEQLNGSVVSLERERDFYYGKLRDVEVLLQSYSGPDKPTADAILQILYATEGDFVSVDEQGNPILPAGEQEGN